LTDLDLSPRDPSDLETRGWTIGGRSVRNVVVLSVLALVLGFVLYQAITSARVFFYNVDEAVARRDELADRTFQMQGTVVAENGIDEVGALLFDLSYGGETAPIRHVGDEPSNLFAVGEQVVVEGYWDGPVFESRQILVKHSEQYIEDNPDRVDYELDPGPLPTGDPSEEPGPDVVEAEADPTGSTAGGT
jgi:cytochrome c-type biogenesis protein CcmE